MANPDLPRLVVYAADVWEHVCPVVRLTGPASAAGLELLHGNEWQDGELRVYPERAAQGDVVIIQRDFPSHRKAYAEVMAAARRSHVPVIYELDDLLLELPEAHPDVLRYVSARSGILRAVVEADAVIGSTPPLTEYLRQFNPQAYCLPNTLDERLWRLRPVRPTNQPLVIGYVGGQSHVYDLQPLAPLLARVLDRHAGQVCLKFWGVPPPEVLRGHLAVEWVNLGLGSYADFAVYLVEQACDIFIAPLQDNLFNRCKSAIKYLEYSALAVPGIYSRIAPYESVVIHGQNGLLAGPLEEWEACLEQLIANPEQRAALGLAAQAQVRANGLLAPQAGKWAELFSHLAARSRPGSQAGFEVRMTNSDKHPDEEAPGSETSHNGPALRAIQQLADYQADLEERLAVQGQQLRELNQQVGSLKVQVTERNRAYLGVLNSNSWRLMELLFRVRQKFVPPGGWLERLARLGLDLLRVLRTQGVRAFLRGAMRRILTPGRARESLERHAAAAEAPPAVESGVPCLSPVLSILVLQDGAAHRPTLDQVCAWAARQTLAEMIQVVVWERSADQAYIAQPQSVHRATWQAPDLQAVCRGLDGRYLCVASHDLLAQAETYLETSLIALESETLALAINVRGQPGWAVERLVQGWLPGNRAEPLLRQVVVKDCLGGGASPDDFSLDLSLWDGGARTPEAALPSLAGRLLAHTSAYPDTPESLPFEIRMAAGLRLPNDPPAPASDQQTFVVKGTARAGILVRPPHSPTPVEGLDIRGTASETPRLLYAVDSVIQAQPVETGLPVVFVIHPYLAVGGAEQIALKAMQELKDRVTFVVLAFEPLDPALGTTTEAFRAITPYVYNLPDFINPALNASFMDYLMRRFKPQALYICNGTPWIYDALPSLKHNFPAVRVINQVYDHQIGWINRYDTSLVLYIDAHIYVNTRIREAYIRHGVRPEDTWRIVNGVVPEELNIDDYTPGKIAALRKGFHLPDGARVVTFASRIHPQKRPMDYVELARRCASDPSLVFLMIGDGPLAQEVDQQIARLGLRNIVRHKFYRPISDVLAVTDVLVLPSEFEGMPMIITEAHTMGKPVVVTDVGANRDVMEITGGGIVIPQIGDVTALLAGVRQMLDHPPEPARLRQVTLENFAVSIVADQYYAVFLGSAS